jgi:hypothetical protein
MVTKGCTSGYAVWVQMKKENENVMVYKNIGRRVLLLQEGGFIEEIKLEGVENLHGRKDYKLTIKGLEQLIPYFLTHTEEIENIVQYMDKFKLDKTLFQKLLTERVKSTLQVLDKYLNVSFSAVDKKLLKEIEERMDRLDKMLGLTDRGLKDESKINELRMLVSTGSSSSRITKDKLDMTVEEISKHYDDCDTCAKLSSEFPRYIISHPDGSSTFKEPRDKNEKLFLGRLKVFLDHYDEFHMNKEDSRMKLKKKAA